jgi:hypothetical protein
LLTTTTTIYENKRCTFCGEIKPLVEEVEVFYNKGRKKRLVFLCFTVETKNNYNNKNVNDCCYYKYFNDLGFKIMVAGTFDKVYRTILSIFISSPLIISSSLPPSQEQQNHNNNSNDKRKLCGGLRHGLDLITAVRIAYHLDQNVRDYLNAVEREKIPEGGEIVSMDNPRLWPIVWQLMHAEPLVEVVSDEDPLVLRWKKEEYSRQP